MMTTEEMLALPDNGTVRWLVRGRLREKPRILADRRHAHALTRLGSKLLDWRDAQPMPRGEVFGGQVGCRLQRHPDTTFSIDIVYISAALAARQPDEFELVEGAPSLAVEILSLSDTNEEIREKVEDYLRAGVQLVWIVDPRNQTVRVYRPKARPVLYNADQELTGDGMLVGFQVGVSDIFK